VTAVAFGVPAPATGPALFQNGRAAVGAPRRSPPWLCVVRFYRHNGKNPVRVGSLSPRDEAKPRRDAPIPALDVPRPGQFVGFAGERTARPPAGTVLPRKIATQSQFVTAMTSNDSMPDAAQAANYRGRTVADDDMTTNPGGFIRARPCACVRIILKKCRHVVI